MAHFKIRFYRNRRPLALHYFHLLSKAGVITLGLFPPGSSASYCITPTVKHPYNGHPGDRLNRQLWRGGYCWGV